MMSLAKSSVGFVREVDSIVVLKLIARAMHGFSRVVAITQIYL